MSDGFDVSLKGIADVESRLVTLGKVGGEKVMRSVLYAATKPILDTAKANAGALIGSPNPKKPSGSGALQKAIRRVYMRPTGLAAGGSRFVVSVAPKSKDRVALALANLVYKRKRPIRGVFWGHLVEWGHKGRGGSDVAGKNIFRRAIDSTRSTAISIFERELAKRVDRAVRRNVAE